MNPNSPKGSSVESRVIRDVSSGTIDERVGCDSSTQEYVHACELINNFIEMYSPEKAKIPRNYDNLFNSLEKANKKFEKVRERFSEIYSKYEGEYGRDTKYSIGFLMLAKDRIARVEINENELNKRRVKSIQLLDSLIGQIETEEKRLYDRLFKLNHKIEIGIKNPETLYERGVVGARLIIEFKSTISIDQTIEDLRPMADLLNQTNILSKYLSEAEKAKKLIEQLRSLSKPTEVSGSYAKMLES